jgi:hypothetical protein
MAKMCQSIIDWVCIFLILVFNENVDFGIKFKFNILCLFQFITQHFNVWTTPFKPRNRNSKIYLNNCRNNLSMFLFLKLNTTKARTWWGIHVIVPVTKMRNFSFSLMTSHPSSILTNSGWLSGSVVSSQYSHPAGLSPETTFYLNRLFK